METSPVSDRVEATIDQRLRLAEVSRRKMLGLLGAGVTGAATLSLPGLLAACAPASGPSSNGPVPETLTVLLPGTVRKVDSLIADINPITMASLAFEGLLAFDNNFRLVPSLAESWSQPDPLTYIYKLRPGVTFWDGTPLTPDDVVNSINLAVSSADSGWGFFYGSFKSIAASGPMEVTIKLTAPDATFKYVLAMGASRVFSKAFAAKQPIEQLGTPAVLNMATGPYKFSALQPDQSVSLVRNDSYWGPKGRYKKLELTIVSDEATRELAMRSGTIDAAWSIPLSSVPQWESIPHTKVYYAPGGTVVFWAFNFDRSPFDDIHVRRAFAHCIDRKGLVSALLHGHGTEAFGLGPPETWGEVLSQADALAFYKSLPQVEFDVTKAKQELALSKVPNGFSTEVTYPSYLPFLGLMAQNVAQNLKQIGITLTVKELPNDLWTAQQLVNTAPLQIYLWFNDYPDPAEMPIVFYSSIYASPNNNNWANYRSPAMDALLAQQGASTGAQRLDLLKQIYTLANHDLPYQPVWWSQATIALNDSKFTYSNLNWTYTYQMWADHIVPR
jgi:peptide/nickel transport system substrate-binding protein